MLEGDVGALREGDIITVAGQYEREPWWRPLRRWLGWPTPARHLLEYVITDLRHAPGLARRALPGELNMTPTELLAHCTRILTDRFCIAPKAWPLPEDLNCIGVDVRTDGLLDGTTAETLWERLLEPMWANLAGAIRYKHHGGAMYQPHWSITVSAEALPDGEEVEYLRLTLITEPDEFKVASAMIRQQAARAA